MYPSRKYTLSFWGTLLVCLLLSAVATQSLGYRANRVERIEAESQLADRANAFKQAIWLRLYKLETLAMTLQLHNGKPAHFFEAARTLVRDGSVCGMLLAPDGIVSNVWPLDQREQYMGLNLLKDPTLQRLINAGKDISLSGPFPVSEDRSVLYGYKLVYLTDTDGQSRFWGILVFCISFEDVLHEAGLDVPELQGRTLQLVWDDGSAALQAYPRERRPALPLARFRQDQEERATISASTDGVLEYTFDTAGTWWVLRVQPVGLWWQNAAVWPFGLGCLVCSLLVALLVRQVCVLHRTRQALELLLNHDQLTGALNRHGLFRALARRLRGLAGRSFLAYMDLNKFKQVNDTYGHEAGDKVLCAFVAAVTRYVDGRHLFARMGGDEFVLIFPPDTAREEVKKTLAGIRRTCAEPLELCPGERVCIEFACGLTFWPEGENSFQAVLRQADTAMYRDKKR
ncbi:diguanylate cyclase [uncultured Desulfovibrio sp.]|uniref:diguanylate cyclase domain-containing protein n=1 Tax=uncultured Desulfovibrio sp. TaxID=167968 RepID=UPI00261A7FC0|nr:diguanylate cyclase [uncultured Desulfovibrio sp.]